MKRIALFPGSFDPFTKGHEDIILRGLRLFDEVVVGIGNNSSKQRYFPLDVMKELIEKTFEKEKNVRVITYNDLTARIAREIGDKFLMIGLRNNKDIE